MDELGPLFVAPHEPDRVALVIAALAASMIVTAAIVVVRGRLPNILSFSGVLVLPIFGYVLGNVHLLEQSKRVDFCGSCHETMSPLVEAMRNDGKSLASVHYRKGAVPHEAACYRCHGGYGLWGDTTAKLAGMRHMVNTVTGNYEFPIEKSGVFDISSCLDCHAQSAPFRAGKAHRDPDIQRSLLSGELGCTGLCHPPAHPPEALLGAAAWETTR